MRGGSDMPTADLDSLRSRVSSIMMRSFYPAIAADKVRVVYSGSGLGFAGDPTSPDVIPLVTVKLNV